MTYVYEITEASLQLGDAPPYRLWPLKVRMNGDMPQICIKSWDSERQDQVETWYDFGKDENVNPPIKVYDGANVVGISSSWKARS